MSTNELTTKIREYRALQALIEEAQTEAEGPGALIIPGPSPKYKEEFAMDPIKMSATLEDSIVHLDQISATLEMVLGHVFEYDAADLNGSEAEITAALKVCEQYPTWRAVLSHVWEALVNERDELAALSMRSVGRA